MQISNKYQFKIKNTKTFACLSFILCLFAYLLIGSIGVFPLSAGAQELQRNITIVPPIIKQTLNPGEKTEGILKVINDSTDTLSFTANVNDFVVDNPNGIPNLLPNNTLSKRFSGASWIGIVPPDFIIAPHGEQVLNYYLQVPLDARPGGHYAAAVYTPTSNVSVKGSGASVQTKMGTLFLITVNGNINESSMVSRFTGNSFQEYGPVKMTTQIINNGDLHITPIGKIVVTDIFGKIVDQQKLTSLDIFPTASRIYTNTTGGKIMIGPFKATLLASYGRNNNLPLSATFYFWVFPWKIALLMLLVIVALILGIMLWRKRGNKQMTDKQISNESPNI